MKRLVLLDFDGTVYHGDSLLDFAKMISSSRFYSSMVVIALMYPLVRMSSNYRERLKRQFLKLNFKGKSKHFLEEKGQIFFNKKFKRCYPKAIEWIQTSDRSDNTIVILSASCSEWLKPFADEWKVELLCTKLAYDENGYCKGNWEGKNLRGKNKINAVKEIYDLEAYDEIAAYGNERADILLKEIADNVELNFFQ